jgi:dephospho-CoA kinase
MKRDYNIFVIGKSKTGKTTFSKKLAALLEMNHIQGSEWVKEKAKEENIIFSEENYRTEITNFALGFLRKDRNTCVDFIKNKYKLENKGFLIEGLRNPYDFMNLVDFNKDYVFFLTLADVNNFKENSVFDYGVDIIEKTVNYLGFPSVNLLSENRVYRFDVTFPIFESSLSLADYAKKSLDSLQ